MGIFPLLKILFSHVEVTQNRFVINIVLNYKFKGRTTFKQYMPKKLIKRGIKMGCRVDSKSGHLSDFDIYVGRCGKETEQNLGYAVVTRLCQAIYGIQYILITFSPVSIL